MCLFQCKIPREIPPGPASGLHHLVASSLASAFAATVAPARKKKRKGGGEEGGAGCSNALQCANRLQPVSRRCGRSILIGLRPFINSLFMGQNSCKTKSSNQTSSARARAGSFPFLSFLSLSWREQSVLEATGRQEERKP